MSFTFANLPGTQVQTVDGGMAAVNTPRTRSVLVFGTSATGPANSPYQVVDPAIAASVFGLNGTLVRTMSEVGAYCDNVFLFRMGTSPATLLVGKQVSGSPALGTSNTVIQGVSVGGVITYTLGTTVSVDVVPGDSIVVAGFVHTDFNGTFTVISASGTSVVVDALGIADYNETHTDVVATADFSVLTGVTLTVTNDIATLNFSGATPSTVPSILQVGHNLTLASLDDSGHTSSAVDGSFTILTKTTSTVTFANTNNHALVTLTAGSATRVKDSSAAVTLRTTAPVTTMDGYTVNLGQVDTAANTRYKVWYASGVLYLWLDGNLVYANDTGNSVVVNTGDSVVTGSSTGGLAVGTSTASLAHAITIAAATALTGDSQHPAPVYTAPVTGIGMTGREIYTAQQDAMDLLQGFPVDIVVTPNALYDQPNIAYYVASDSTTATNNPLTNADALAWLKTTVDNVGNKVYHWSSDATDSAGNADGGAVVYTSAVTRLAAGYHEVNFGYQLARFCAAQSEAPQATNAGCLGFIGTAGPANLSNFSLPAVRTWIGFLPKYDSISGNPTVPGGGLLGIPYLSGTTSAKLHAATSDQSNGFRIPGFFSTSSGEYDGGSLIDANGSKVDIGAYTFPQGDWALQSNGFGQYVGNIAGLVAGLTSSLDQKNAATNKPVAGVQQLYRASLTQLNDLTQISLNVLKYKGPGRLPVCLHDKTAAQPASDYIFGIRQRIKFLMIQTVLEAADAYIGNTTNDGLQLVSLKTALDANALNLKKRGYISGYNFTITSTAADQKIGRANIQISFVPANELIQLFCTIGVNLAS